MSESAAQKIYTKSGMARENPFLGKKVLHVGCGTAKLPGATGVDVLKLSGVDVVHDLDKTPWPFADNTFDVILAHSVLEHVDSVLHFMNEAYRVGKPDARLVICVPYFRSVDAYDDPTHRHFFTSRSMEYFLDDGNSLAAYSYSGARFKKIGFWYGWPHPSRNPIPWFLKKTAHRFPHFYDQYLSLLLPVKVLFWDLEVIKNKNSK